MGEFYNFSLKFEQLPILKLNEVTSVENKVKILNAVLQSIQRDFLRVNAATLPLPGISEMGDIDFNRIPFRRGILLPFLLPKRIKLIIFALSKANKMEYQ